MEFIRGNPTEAGRMLATALLRELFAGKRVLWLVCGGSNVSIAAEAWKEVSAQAAKGELERLFIALTDERFGQIGHADSNWKQLSDAGVDLSLSKSVPVLRGLSQDETVAGYERDFRELVDKADIAIAQFGIGSDGHIAGILPNSPAVASARLVEGYEAKNFTRITLTIKALREIDLAYAFVFGESKRKAIEDLRGKDLSLAEQPAQILKEIPNAILASDQI